MKFQNHILNFERMDAQMDGQAQSNMPLQLFQSWGHINFIFFAWLQEHLGLDLKIVTLTSTAYHYKLRRRSYKHWRRTNIAQMLF